MSPPRILGCPEAGFWLGRFCKGGPLVPASIVRIDLSREPGNPENLLDRWPLERLLAYVIDIEVPVERVWHTKTEPIARAEHDYQVALIRWLRRHRPDDPRCKPFHPVKLDDLRPIL